MSCREAAAPALPREGTLSSAETPRAGSWGPLRPNHPGNAGGRRYILLLVDDYSRFMWVLLLASKDEAERAIVKQQAAAEVECGHKLRMLRTDRGGKFTSATFYKHCTEKGVKRHLKAPYSPQKNGVIE